jgi:hypothetical protein
VQGQYREGHGFSRAVTTSNLIAALAAEPARLMNRATDRFASLNNAEYLYLRGISEPRDNALRIVVQEATANRDKTGPVELPGLSGTFPTSSAARIESTETSKTFVLHWSRYIAYLVTEEAVGSCGNRKDETFTGRFFRVYEKSHLLDHIARDTGASIFKPFKHYKIICLNHLVDVVSTTPPEIEILDDGGPKASQPAVQ